MRRGKRLPTSVVIPVDPEFVGLFCEGGWQRVERIYGKRRVQTWVSAMGRQKLINMRRAYVAEQRQLRRIAAVSTRRSLSTARTQGKAPEL